MNHFGALKIFCGTALCKIIITPEACGKQIKDVIIARLLDGYLINYFSLFCSYVISTKLKL